MKVNFVPTNPRVLFSEGCSPSASPIPFFSLAMIVFKRRDLFPPILPLRSLPWSPRISTALSQIVKYKDSFFVPRPVCSAGVRPSFPVPFVLRPVLCPPPLLPPHSLLVVRIFCSVSCLGPCFRGAFVPSLVPGGYPKRSGICSCFCEMRFARV